MSRIITGIAFDLKFNVLDTPPGVTVLFADVAPGGQETHARTSVDGPSAHAVWRSIEAGTPILEAVNAALDAQAAAVREPGVVAARMQAADDAKRVLSAAQQAKAALDAEHAAVTSDLAARRAELVSLRAAGGK